VDEIKVMPCCSIGAACSAEARKSTAPIDLAGHTVGAEYAGATVANGGASKILGEVDHERDITHKERISSVGIGWCFGCGFHVHCARPGE
jgi:hypothetical protein